MTEQKKDFNPDLAVPPGESLREILEERGLSQTELASRMGRPLKTVNEIVKGKASITADTAIQLESVLGIPASFWNNLERLYQESRARLRAEEQLAGEVNRLDQFPYAQMCKLNWIQKQNSPSDRVKELLKFFGVSSLETLPSVEAAAYRLAKNREASPGALAAWLRKGQADAQTLDCKPYNAQAFEASLSLVRSLTREKPAAFSKKLTQLCAGCGVAVVFVPHLQGTYAHGATQWLGSGQPLIQLSLRNKYDDIFWFTFFHEAGHILRHGQEELIVEFDKNGKGNDRKEQEADRFAADILIPPKPFEEFCKAGDFSKNRVRAFAREIGIAPSIVVGRMQHDGWIERSWLNGLRTRLPPPY